MSNNYRISNEQLMLINILNTMYNDNLRQITNITEMLHNLNENNNQIRNLLIQLLNNQQNSARRSTTSERRFRGNNDRNSNRVYINNTPYIIDAFAEYTIPSNLLSSQRNGQTDSTALLNNFFNSFMQPVDVYPTQSQIESATRRVQYCNIARPINTQCPISMDEFNDTDMVTVIRHCGHIFHTEHLMNWFRSNCRCPVCRYDIREFNSNASTEFFSNNSQTIRSNPIAIHSSNEYYDSSNNGVERQSGNNNFRSDEFNNVNISNFTDVSGNYIDNLDGGVELINRLLNIINRNRYY